MKINPRRIVVALGIYIVQVGTLWGLLEGYTYFNGDALKEFLGGYWILVYIIPVFTTAYIVWHEKSGNASATEDIKTEGSFSPGKVDGSYRVKTRLDQLPEPGRVPALREPLEEDDTKENFRDSDRRIHTKGDYSPGEVGGDYNVEI